MFLGEKARMQSDPLRNMNVHPPFLHHKDKQISEELPLQLLTPTVRVETDTGLC